MLRLQGGLVCCMVGYQSWSPVAIPDTIGHCCYGSHSPIRHDRFTVLIQVVRLYTF